MKAERRHDLQHNTLDAELAKGIDFFRRHGNKILLVVLLLAVVFTGWGYLDRRAGATRADVQRQYNQLKRSSLAVGTGEAELLDGFQSLSSQDAVRWIAADSLLQVGLIHSTQSLQTKTSDERDQARLQAKASFNRVIDDFPLQVPIVAGAKLGLAKLAEDEGNFKLAGDLYQAVIDTKALAGYPVVNQARLAKLALANLKNDIVLAKNPPPWTPKVEKKSPAPKAPAQADKKATK